MAPNPDVIRETRPLHVTQAEAKLLYDLLEGHKQGNGLRADLERLLHEFKDTALQVRELARTLRANGFWEEDKTANDAYLRAGGKPPTVAKIKETLRKVVSKKKRQRSTKVRKIRKQQEGRNGSVE